MHKTKYNNIYFDYCMFIFLYSKITNFCVFLLFFFIFNFYENIFNRNKIVLLTILFLKYLLLKIVIFDLYFHILYLFVLYF